MKEKKLFDPFFEKLYPKKLKAFTASIALKFLDIFVDVNFQNRALKTKNSNVNSAVVLSLYL